MLAAKKIMADKMDNKKQAYAKAKSIRTSGQKLNLVAKSIRGCNIKVAIDQLTFSKKRVSKEVLKVLNSAIVKSLEEILFHWGILAAI